FDRSALMTGIVFVAPDLETAFDVDGGLWSAEIYAEQPSDRCASSGVRPNLLRISLNLQSSASHLRSVPFQELFDFPITDY
ncbi:MAG: hypothetical protein ACRD7E_19200, partial [Bryobacteraceae bacterium]